MYYDLLSNLNENNEEYSKDFFLNYLFQFKSQLRKNNKYETFNEINSNHNIFNNRLDINMNECNLNINCEINKTCNINANQSKLSDISNLKELTKFLQNNSNKVDYEMLNKIKSCNLCANLMLLDLCWECKWKICKEYTCICQECKKKYCYECALLKNFEINKEIDYKLYGIINKGCC